MLNLKQFSNSTEAYPQIRLNITLKYMLLFPTCKIKEYIAIFELELTFKIFLETLNYLDLPVQNDMQVLSGGYSETELQFPKLS